MTEATKPEPDSRHEDPPEPLLRFFRWGHLSVPLQSQAKLFGELAHTLVETTPRSPERTVALRKLLESKDAAVRALLPEGDS